MQYAHRPDYQEMLPGEGGREREPVVDYLKKPLRRTAKNVAALVVSHWVNAVVFFFQEEGNGFHGQLGSHFSLVFLALL